MADSQIKNAGGLLHALLSILDAVDYTAHNCSPTQPVAPLLPPELIKLARKEIKKSTPPVNG